MRWPALPDTWEAGGSGSVIRWASPVIVAMLRVVDPLLERTVRLPSLFGKR